MMSQPSILIVEDERIPAEELSIQLQTLGYRVAGIEASGEKALRRIEEAPPDLVLMDIHLSGKMTGDEVAAVLRESRPIPVIFLTAYSDPHTVERVKRTEPYGFIVKPYIESELKGVIEMALYRYQMEMRLRESELRFSRLAEASFEGIGISDQGVLIDSNEQLARMFGYRTDEIIGKQVIEFVAPESRDLVKDNMRSGFEGPYEHLALRKDGSVFPVEIRAKQVSFDGRNVRVTAVRDVSEAKKTAEALRESQEFFRILFEESPIPIILSDLSTGIIVYGNKKLMSMIGLTEQEVLGRRAVDLGLLYDPKDQARMVEMHRTRGSIDDLEVKSRLPQGRTGYNLVSMRIITLNGKQHGLITVQNITERKEMEKTLRESENRIRTIIEQSSEGLILTDENGSLLEWNPAMEKLTGLKREEVLGLNFTETQERIATPESKYSDHKESYRKMIQDALRTGESPLFTRPFETEIVRSDGERRFFRHSVFPIQLETGFRLGAIINDITTQKKMEEALRESEEKYRNIVEHSSDGFAIILDGRITYANNRIAVISRYPMTQIVGMPFVKFMVPEQASIIQDRYRRRLAGEDVPNVYETRIMTRDKKPVDVEFRVDLIQYQGKPAAFVWMRDITERNRYQEALEKVQRSFHLASLGALAAGIAHEINQPLTAIKSKVDGLLYWGEEKPELLRKDMARHLQFISDEAAKIDQIVKHMRSLIRREKSSASLLDVNETIRKACSFTAQQLASHGIELKLRLSSDNPKAVIQSTALEQVVINLLQNAMNALDRLDKIEKMITITTRILKDQCAIDVSDNGPGIPSEYLDRIFDPLFTTGHSEKGMGLGLPIVQNLVNDMGGSIQIKHPSGGGARFRILLPLSCP
jgi:PAS domain S-box-containing protein